LKTQEFIESGILESHLMGFTNKEEQEQVRQMMQADDRLAAYVEDLESNMKAYFERDSVMPPRDTREVIQLRNDRSSKQKHNLRDTVPNSTPYLDIEVNDTHMKVHKLWRPAFVAVFILSKIFLIAGLYYYFKSASQAEELQRLKMQVEQTK
jgi:hypothetical protein